MNNKWSLKFSLDIGNNFIIFRYLSWALKHIAKEEETLPIIQRFFYATMQCSLLMLIISVSTSFWQTWETCLRRYKCKKISLNLFFFAVSLVKFWGDNIFQLFPVSRLLPKFKITQITLLICNYLSGEKNWSE